MNAGWEAADIPTAARDFARMVRHRLLLDLDWSEETPEPRLWVWRDTEGDFQRVVVVDGRERVIRDSNPDGHNVIPPPRGLRTGPTVTGYYKDVVVSVTLPQMTDRGDLDSTMAALEAIGAVPSGGDDA